MSNSIMDKLRAKQKAASTNTPSSVTAKPVTKPTISNGINAALKGTVDTSNAGMAGQQKDLGNPLSKAKSMLEQAQQKVMQKQEAGTYNVSSNALPQDLDAETLSTKLANLDMALLAKTPELPVLQLEIMRNLRQYEELTHILTDEQLSIIVSGCMELANVSIAKGTNGAGKAATAKLDSLTSGMGASDF